MLSSLYNNNDNNNSIGTTTTANNNNNNIRINNNNTSNDISYRIQQCVSELKKDQNYFDVLLDSREMEGCLNEECSSVDWDVSRGFNAEKDNNNDNRNNNNNNTGLNTINSNNNGDINNAKEMLGLMSNNVLESYKQQLKAYLQNYYLDEYLAFIHHHHNNDSELVEFITNAEYDGRNSSGISEKYTGVMDGYKINNGEDNKMECVDNPSIVNNKSSVVCKSILIQAYVYSMASFHRHRHLSFHSLKLMTSFINTVKNIADSGSGEDDCKDEGKVDFGCTKGESIVVGGVGNDGSYDDRIKCVSTENNDGSGDDDKKNGGASFIDEK